MKNKSNVKRGFTLVELLIVVLIVGILVSVALPLYQNAVDKSRWAKLLSPSRAIANAEEAILMSNGAYTVNKEDLVVSLPNAGEYTYTLYTTENGDDGDLVRVSSNKLEDVRLARHYEKDARFPNQLYCEAKVGNARAKKLCEKLLQGSEVFTTDDGYKMYFLSGQMSEAVCEGADGWWSNNFTKCYASEKERCVANGMPYNDVSGLCGYRSYNSTKLEIDLKEGAKCVTANSYACQGITFHAGSECEITEYGGCIFGTWKSGTTCNANTGGSCGNGVFEDGSVCIATGDESCASNYQSRAAGGMDGSVFKSGSRCEAYGNGSCGGTFEAGSVCIAHGGVNSCGLGFGTHSVLSTFKAGSKCVAEAAGTCNGTYESGSCCEGNCPATVKDENGNTISTPRC
ncbi:MAG: prepilin-type N-terminal cleavage/methylation domain-containing protein [Elusimicrobiaceae bacterium]|nr:prepilin-type N-terminal cleavage/methylation domain-containing protein [Elusimicrobiaceae bacterium]